MKLKTLLFAGLILLGVTGTLNAQIYQIHNGSFENWQNVGSNTEEPSRWNSNKTGTGQATSGPQTCFRETSNPYDGLYSVRIETKSITIIFVTFIVNGSCSTGRVEAPSTNKSEGFTHSIKSDSIYGSTFNGRPDSIVGYYRYTSVSSDYGKIGVFLHVGNYYDPETPVGGNHPDSTVNKIASGTFLTPTSSVANWTKFSIPLTYFDSRNPEYILISMTSSGNQTGGASGSKLWVDGMKAFYNPALMTGAITPATYFVDASNGAAISIPFILTGTMNPGNIVTAQLSDASGSFASPVVLGTLNTTISGTINGMIPAGTTTGGGYRIRVVSSNYAITAADNGNDIVISDVTDIFDNPSENNHVYFSENALIADLQQASFNSPHIQLFDVTGRMIAGFELLTNSMNRVELNIPSGIYMYRLSDGNKTNTGKIVKL